MPDSGGQQVDLRRLLAVVEEAPPIDVVDVLASELATMVDAGHVSLLIANVSGNAVVRLSHIVRGRGLRDGHNERAESLPLAVPATHAPPGVDPPDLPNTSVAATDYRALSSGHSAGPSAVR